MRLRGVYSHSSCGGGTKPVKENFIRNKTNQEFASDRLEAAGVIRAPSNEEAKDITMETREDSQDLHRLIRDPIFSTAMRSQKPLSLQL